MHVWYAVEMAAHVPIAVEHQMEEKNMMCVEIVFYQMIPITMHNARELAGLHQLFYQIIRSTIYKSQVLDLQNTIPLRVVLSLEQQSK